jgi:hypothetical protein
MISERSLTSSFTDPRWPFRKRRFADMSTIRSALTPADAVAIADIYRATQPDLVGVGQAIVSSFRHELARRFEREIDTLGSTTVVFALLEHACRWLEVKPRAVSVVIAGLRAELRDHAPGPPARQRPTRLGHTAGCDW